MLTKRIKKKLDGNDTRILHDILNKFCKQHPTKQHQYGHLPPISQTIQVRRTKHTRHCWRRKDEFISDILLWTPTYGCASVDWPAKTYISSVWTQGAIKKTCQERWIIGMDGERKRESGNSVISTRFDNDYGVKNQFVLFMIFEYFIVFFSFK